MIKDDSPFTPGKPVPLDLFVGRENKLEELVRIMKQSASGKQENIFLIGDRGIGKSSLAHFLRSLAIKEAHMMGVHVFLGGISTNEELVHHILEKILNESSGKSWFEKIKGLFGDYVRGVGLFGLSLTFAPPEDKLEGITNNFHQVLKSIIDQIKDEKKGLFIALDDINGLANNPDFANWYKSFVDEVATTHENFPVFLMLIGLPDRRDALFKHQESLGRIFNITEIDRLSNEDVEQFYTKAFSKVGMTIESDTMEQMVLFSGGLPVVMHEIGDAVYWLVQDNVVSVEDAVDGVFEAAERIGKKYLEPKVYRTIRSERYRSILRKIGSFSPVFTRKEIVSKLTREEQNVFDNFIKTLRKLGIIEPYMELGRGAYSFVNPIYPVYIHLESVKQSDSD